VASRPIKSGSSGIANDRDVGPTAHSIPEHVFAY
jgi:hypothetical protein